MSPEEKAAAAAIAAEAEDLSDIRTHLQPVAVEFGREVFEQVYRVGVAQHAIQLLAAGTGRGRAPDLFNATLMAAEMFNRLSSALCAVKGWTPEELAACDAAIQRATANKIIVPRESGRLILDS